MGPMIPKEMKYNLHHGKIAKKKINTVRLCRPDAETNQDLQCLPRILSHFTLNGVKSDQML